MWGKNSKARRKSENSGAGLIPAVEGYSLYNCASRLTEIGRLVGLVVKASALREEDPAFAVIFPGSSRTSDLKIGTPVATLPGAWRKRVSAATGWPGVGIM